MGVTDFVLEITCPEEHLNLSKSGAKKTTMAASPKILQLALWREMFSAKYGLNGPILGEFSQQVRFLKEQVRI